MEAFKQIMELSPPVLLGVALNFLGLFLKKSPVKSWTIPMILIGVGAALYPMIADASKVSFQTKNPEAFNAVIGGCVGGFSVGMNQVFRQFVRRFGWKDDDDDELSDPPAVDPLTRAQRAKMPETPTLNSLGL